MPEGPGANPDAGAIAEPRQSVPIAKFIGNVDKYLEGRTPESAIKALDADYRQYRLLENQLLQKRARLVGKLPEIQKAKNAVEMLTKKAADQEEAVVDFPLSNTVFAKAKVPPAKHVNLWLGANVMLEYDLEEADSLLKDNVASCKEALDTNKRDLALIKDCITTTEVSLARVYNYDVAQKRKTKPKQGDS
eukprot:jgi/Astpho2/439/Aster-03487